MILDKIVNDNRALIEKSKLLFPFDAVEKMALAQPRAIDLEDALSGNEISLIAEIKKASPSKGVIRNDFDPVEIAGIYSSSGAAAISILTEPLYFKGNIKYIDQVKKTVPGLSIPVLRKDFIHDPYQVYESRAYGADCILLIVAILSTRKLTELLTLSHELGMKCLVEVHNKSELDIALNSEARIIGINNRDLNTFEVDISTTERLCSFIPPDRIVVSESGIKTRSDIERLKNCNVNAVLVGEALMSSRDIKAKIKELM